MCLIGFHYQPANPVPLIVAGNRDEFYARATAPLAWWVGGRVLAGQDLWSGGTWMGVSRDGRFATVTNFRDPRSSKHGAPSRGFLPLRFLDAGGSVAAFMDWLRKEAPRFSPFNVLAYDGLDLVGYESRGDRIVEFAPGIHGVSNGDFDEPWPKVAALKASMPKVLDDDGALLTLLADTHRFADDILPHTGFPIEWERALSSAFVRAPTYGTRTSTIIRMGQETISMLEQRYAPEGPEGQSEFQFHWRSWGEF